MRRSFFFVLLLAHTVAVHAQPRQVPTRVAPGTGVLKTSVQADAGEPTPTEVWELKIDALGRMLIAGETSRAKALSEGEGLMRQLPAGRLTSAGEEWVDVFVRTDEAAGLAVHGYVERASSGGISVGRVPMRELRALASDARVRYVETSRVARRRNAVARQETGVNRVHAGEGFASPIKGQGVVVGVLDSGIDFTHPDFSSPNGTRIRFLMDMRANLTDDVYSKSQIDSNPGSITQRDGNWGYGHGTHVSSTAAGLSGVAQEADIVFVKGIRDQDSDGGFSDADVATGVDFIFDKAAELGKPAVVNLSLGGNYGPLDGTSAYEQFLSNQTGPGKLIVAAAGNEGDYYIHAGTNLRPSVLYETLMEPMDSYFNYIDMWYKSGSIASVRFGFYDLDLMYLGSSPAVNVGSSQGITGGGALNPVAVRYNNQIIGYVAVDARTTVDPNNGDGNIQLVLTNNNNSAVDLNNFYWTVLYRATSTASGRVDMWYSSGEFYPFNVGLEDVTEITGDTDFTVGSPATARKVISVGSYVGRRSWSDIDGRTWSTLAPNPNPELDPIVPVAGSASYFTSRGPTRDGRLAPVISAPGQMVAAALASNLSVRANQDDVYELGGVFRGDIVQGGGVQVMQGTSMSSPHVAGIVALMLQVNPTLTYDQAVSILAQTARTDIHTGVAPNVTFGNGKIDAHAAVMRALTLTSIDKDPHPERSEGPGLLANYPNPFNPTTEIGYRISEIGKTRIDVFNVLGQRVATLVDGVQAAGTHLVTFDASGLPSGMYLVVLESAGMRDVRKVSLVK
jgi:minor extracellular serine protease Vpr